MNHFKGVLIYAHTQRETDRQLKSTHELFIHRSRHLCLKILSRIYQYFFFCCYDLKVQSQRKLNFMMDANEIHFIFSHEFSFMLIYSHPKMIILCNHLLKTVYRIIIIIWKNGRTYLSLYFCIKYMLKK